MSCALVSFSPLALDLLLQAVVAWETTYPVYTVILQTGSVEGSM